MKRLISTPAAALSISITVLIFLTSCEGRRRTEGEDCFSRCVIQRGDGVYLSPFCLVRCVVD